jgi:hypothetical protein
VQAHVGFPDPAVPVDIKVVGLQELGDVIIGLRVYHDRADHSLLRLTAVRHDLRPRGLAGFCRYFAHMDTPI